MEDEGYTELLELKHKLQKKIVEVFSQHLYNYFTRCFKKSVNYVDFQKKMIKIAEWKESKKRKSLKKFIKWCFKNNYDIEQMFQKLLLTSIRAILNDKYLSEIVITKYCDSTGLFDKFFYKVLKRVAQYYYENPKIDIIDDDDYIEDVIKTSIVLFIPINKIVDMFGKKKEDLIIQYDFNNIDSSSSYDLSSELSNNNGDDTDNTVTNSKVQRKIVVEKESDDGSMMYLPSEEFDIEEVQEKDLDADVDKEKDEEEKNIKHITIVKNNGFTPYHKFNRFYKKNVL
jgi:hypothetical protein